MQYTNGSSDAAVTNKNYCRGESAHLHRPMTSHIPLKTADYSTKFWIQVLRHNHNQHIRQRGDQKISNGQGSPTSATTASNFSNSMKVFFSKKISNGQGSPTSATTASNFSNSMKVFFSKKISNGQGSPTSATTASNFSNSMKVFFHFSFFFACCCWGVGGEGGLPSTLLWCVKYCHTAFNLFRVFDVMHVALLVKQGSVTI